MVVPITVVMTVLVMMMMMMVIVIMMTPITTKKPSPPAPRLGRSLLKLVITLRTFHMVVEVRLPSLHMVVKEIRPVQSQDTGDEDSSEEEKLGRMPG